MTLTEDPDVAPQIDILAAGPEHLNVIRALHATRFGPGRFARTAYRVRENAGDWPSQHCRVAVAGDKLLGSVTATLITLPTAPPETENGILIGPVVVAEPHTGQTLGQQLIEACVASAEAAGESFALLVGDLAYYQRVGFAIARPPLMAGPAELPGPADPNRILIRSLNGFALSKLHGRVTARH